MRTDRTTTERPEILIRTNLRTATAARMPAFV